jgi:hypothetical protein
MACVVSCQLAQNTTLVNDLRNAGRQLCANGSEMANGRQSLWIIYKHFASPNDGDTERGLSPNYSILDLQLAQMKGEDEGLERYWTQWITTIAHIPDEEGSRSVFQHLFVDEMRLAPLTQTYVLVCNEADAGTEKHTWEWLLKKGQASFQRERARDNQLRKQKALRGINPSSKAVHFGAKDSTAVPAYDTSRNGEQPKPKQQAVNDTTEQTPREKCWYWNRFGRCPKKNCPRDHKLMTDEKRQRCPTASGVKDARGRQRDKEVIQNAVEMGKEEATKTGAKLKEKERGQRSWAAGAQILVKCARMVRNVIGCGRATNPMGPRRNLTGDLRVEREKMKTKKFQKRTPQITIQLAVLGLHLDHWVLNEVLNPRRKSGKTRAVCIPPMLTGGC